MYYSIHDKWNYMKIHKTVKYLYFKNPFVALQDHLKLTSEGKNAERLKGT